MSDISVVIEYSYELDVLQVRIGNSHSPRHEAYSEPHRITLPPGDNIIDASDRFGNNQAGFILAFPSHVSGRLYEWSLEIFDFSRVRAALDFQKLSLLLGSEIAMKVHEFCYADLRAKRHGNFISDYLSAPPQTPVRFTVTTPALPQLTYRTFILSRYFNRGERVPLELIFQD